MYAVSVCGDVHMNRSEEARNVKGCSESADKEEQFVLFIFLFLFIFF